MVIEPIGVIEVDLNETRAYVLLLEIQENCLC